MSEPELMPCTASEDIDESRSMHAAQHSMIVTHIVSLQVLAEAAPCCISGQVEVSELSAESQDSIAHHAIEMPCYIDQN